MRSTNNQELHQNLRQTPFCRFLGTPIVELAREITAQNKGRAAADAIFDWVRDSVTYRVIGLESADRTLRRREGCCLAKSNLVVAMCRSIDIPARYYLFSGKLLSPCDDIANIMVQHVVPEIYVEGNWLSGDPAYEASLAAVYKTGSLGEVTWSSLGSEKRFSALPRWLWLGQRLAIWFTPGAWKVRRAVDREQKDIPAC